MAAFALSGMPEWWPLRTQAGSLTRSTACPASGCPTFGTRGRRTASSRPGGKDWTRGWIAGGFAAPAAQQRRRRRRTNSTALPQTFAEAEAGLCTEAQEEHEGPPEQMPAWIVESFRTNSRLTGLVWLMSEDELLEAAKTLHWQDVLPGQYVITQGSVGSRFYVIEYGSFEVFVSSEAHAEPGIKVDELGPGDSFGELALLYSIPRSATVVATSQSRLWVMERQDFQAAVSKGCQQLVSPKFMEFVGTVPLFKGTSGALLKQLGRSLIPQWFGKGEEIISQGNFQERFYILRTGEALAVVQGPDGEQEVERYCEPGAIIGANVLLNEHRSPSKVVVRSISDVTVVFWMSKLTFDNVAGTSKEQMLMNMREQQPQSQEQCVCM